MVLRGRATRFVHNANALLTNRQNTSEWTLDYPPFFAYFEWAMSRIAGLLHPDMLRIANLGYDSWQTIYFQRATVLITELMLLGALVLYVAASDG